MSPLDRATDALATFRLTKLAIEDKITEPLRDRIVGDKDPDDSYIATLFSCYWCFGMWVSFGVVVARRLVPGLWEPLAQALAASAITGLVAEREP